MPLRSELQHGSQQGRKRARGADSGIGLQSIKYRAIQLTRERQGDSERWGKAREAPVTKSYYLYELDKSVLLEFNKIGLSEFVQ